MTSVLRPALATLLLASFARAAVEDAADAARAPRALRVELRSDESAPPVVEEARPRFSWVIDDARRGAAQSAYQVLVAASPTTLRQESGDLWDSTKVLSPSAIGVEYAGKPLPAGRTVYWAVRTWDAIGKPSPWSAPASFVVASPAGSAWEAQWIRAGREPDASSIGHKSEIAAAEDAWPWIQFDFGGDVKCDRVRLHPAHPDGDATKPGALFPLQVKVYTDLTGQFGSKSIRIAEYSWQDVPNAGAGPLDLTLPSTYTLRWLRIVATKIPKDGDRGYAMALGEVEVLDGAQNVAQRGRLTVSGSSGEAGYTPLALVDGALVPEKSVAPKPESLPRLRRSFTIDQEVARARLRATALGAYELTLNGKPVGDARLAPGWTDYAKRVAYQTYDVTSLLHRGDNVIGVQLAPGWFAGRIGFAAQLGAGRARAIYGSEPAFLAECDVVLDNGKHLSIRTDEDWRWNRGGPLLAADVLDGESRDARLETAGWNEPYFQGAGWRPVEIAADLKPATTAQRAAPVREREVRPALSVRASGPDSFVYDFGQNVSGVVRIRLSGLAGTAVTVQHAEALGADGKLELAGLRTATQTDVHVLRGGVETLEPRFTVHGFRYAEVTGLPEALEPSSIEAVVLGNDLPDTGMFRCSDDALNRLWNAASATLRANLVAIPTACPQDDERVAWLGDVETVAPFALHRVDCAELLSAWLGEVRAAQSADGCFTDFAPDPFGRAGRALGTPGQGDAGVLVPWEIYLRTHDLKLLRSSVAPALAWLKRVAAANPDGIWAKERGADLGDDRGTTAADRGAVAKDLYATAFLAHSARVASKMAFAAGDLARQGEARAIADRAAEAFRTAIAEKSRLKGDAQAAYALALDFGLCASDEQAADFADRLAARIREQGRLTCGFQTANRALIALSQHGHHALALDLARRTTSPSWGEQLANGSTTLGEAGGDAARSRSRLAAASVGEWLVRCVAGLELADEHADSGSVALVLDPAGGSRTTAEGAAPWSRIRFAPHVTGGVTSASATHESLAGRIACEWKLEGDALAYACTVPPGSTATLELPAKDVESVTLDGKPVAESKDLRARAGDPGVVRLELASGRYELRSKVK